jgi:serine/threonine protein kinase
MMEEQQIIYYDDFEDFFVPDLDEYGNKIIYVTHEMSSYRKMIFIGMFRGRRVALKCGQDIVDELNINKIIAISKHPNVIRMIAEVLHQDGGYPSILMEGVKNGLTLADYSRLSPALSWRSCISLMKQIASGLQHLHNIGVVHHDLKAENILVELESKISSGIESDDITMKICDFGVSEIVDDLGHCKLENKDLGTYHCMAPEQRSSTSNEPITAKIDIYAFSGLCTSILLKGRTLDQVLYTIPSNLLAIINICKNDKKEMRPSLEKVIQTFDYLLALDDTTKVRSYQDIIVQNYQTCLEKGIPFPDNLEDLYNTVKEIQST